MSDWQRLLFESQCASGMILYSLIAFYATFVLTVKILELPFKFYDWWRGE